MAWGRRGGGGLGSSAMGPAPPPLVSNAAAKPSSPASPEETRGGASSLASNSAPPSATNNVADGKPSKETDLVCQPSKETEPRATGDKLIPTAPIRKKVHMGTWGHEHGHVGTCTSAQWLHHGL